jgi:hypothetical protein
VKEKKEIKLRKRKREIESDGVRRKDGLRVISVYSYNCEHT